MINLLHDLFEAYPETRAQWLNRNPIIRQFFEEVDDHTDLCLCEMSEEPWWDSAFNWSTWFRWNIEPDFHDDMTDIDYSKYPFA